MEEEDGVLLPKEPPPYDIVGNKCYGCLTLQEEQDEVEDDHKRSVHFHFTRHRSSV